MNDIKLWLFILAASFIVFIPVLIVIGQLTYITNYSIGYHYGVETAQQNVLDNYSQEELMKLIRIKRGEVCR